MMQEYSSSTQSWQITFADLTALLLCFFVLRFALYMPDEHTAQQRALIGQKKTEYAIRAARLANEISRAVSRDVNVRLAGLGAVSLENHLTENVNKIATVARENNCAVQIIAPLDSTLSPFKLRDSFSEQLGAHKVSAGRSEEFSTIGIVIDVTECQQ